jgi:hypothetical protein
MGQGRAYLGDGKLAQAAAGLKEAVQIFNTFEDAESTGLASYLLGRAYHRMGNKNEAVSAYVTSAEAYQTTDDHLARTKTFWFLETLTQANGLPKDLRLRVDRLAEQAPERHALARFPNRILRLYRRLALRLALPLAYATAFVVGSVLSLVLAVFETILLLQLRQGIHIPILEFLAILFRFAFILLTISWIYPTFYAIIGTFVVRILGRRLDTIEQEQPDRVVLEESGISNHPGQSIQGAPTEEKPFTQRLEWSEITGWVSADYKVFKRPIHLISRTFLIGSSGILMIEGITAGYEAIKRHIETYASSDAIKADARNRDFVFIEPRWTLVSTLASAVVSSFLYLAGRFDVNAGFEDTGELILLPVSSVVFFLIPTLLLLLPTVTLWRLFIHITVIEKEIGRRANLFSKGQVLFWAIFITLLLTGWVLLLLFAP